MRQRENMARSQAQPVVGKCGDTREMGHTHTHIIVNWMEWEHMLGIAYYQQGEAEPVDLIVAESITRSGLEEDVLLRRPMKPGSFTPRVTMEDERN